MTPQELNALYPRKNSFFHGMGYTKSDVFTMQNLLVDIAGRQRSKGRADIIFVTQPGWADGIIGPGTTKAVNLIVRKALKKPPISTASVKKNLAAITNSAAIILSRLKAATPPAPAPTPAPTPSPTGPPTPSPALPPATTTAPKPPPVIVPPKVSTTLSDARTLQVVLQAIAKLTSSTVLAYTLKPGWADGVIGPGTAKAVNIAIRKKIGKPPIGIASVRRNILKITETGLKIVEALKANLPKVTLIKKKDPTTGEKKVAPVAIIETTDPVTGAKKKALIPVAVKTNPKTGEKKVLPVIVTKDPVTGRKKMSFPPVKIVGKTAKEKMEDFKRKQAALLSSYAMMPEIKETEEYLERFFAQEAIAGVGYREPLPLTYDTRRRSVPHPLHSMGPIPKVEIMSGHDEMDDADEELAEMEASGFSKGWW